MRWLKTCYLLILIALAFAPSASGQLPKEEKSLSKNEQSPSGKSAEAAKNESFVINPETSRTVGRTTPQKNKNDPVAKRPEASIAEWLMVGITSAYVVVAFFQLRAIRRQADISERALVDLERPWVFLNQVKWPSGVFPLPDEHDPVPRYVGFAYSFKNVGKTPAWITAAAATLIRLDNMNELPPEPIYPPSFVDAEIPLAPDVPSGEVGQQLQPTPTMNAVDIIRLERREVFLYAYGYVRYVDAFRREHETRFGSVYIVPIVGIDAFRGLRIAGPPAYNRHT